jgi:hypothetical protein
VYDIILSYIDDSQRHLAVDVATGSGQAAVQLADHFKQVCTSLAHADSLELLPSGESTSWNRAKPSLPSPVPLPNATQAGKP